MTSYALVDNTLSAGYFVLIFTESSLGAVSNGESIVNILNTTRVVVIAGNDP